MSSPVRTRPPIDARISARRREVARAAARRRRRVTASVLTAVAAAAAAVALTYTPLFAVTDVHVAGADGEREQQVRSAAGVVVGERLLGIDLEATAAEVEALPWIRTAEVARQPPSTVEIRVEPRVPVAVVHAGGESWLVDAEAVVVAGGAADDLVVVDAPEAVLPGSGATVTDPAVRNALATHHALPEPLRRAVVRYEAPSGRGLRALLDEDAIEHVPDGGLWVRLGIAERVEDKARVIVLLLGQLDEQSARLGGTPIAEFDVRAPDNPVVIPAD